MGPRSASIVIVGGGIAGSALAIALARRSIASTLVEREQEWVPASSGIFIYSNGLAALDRLGVLEEICESGWVSPDGGNLYLTAAGEEITRTTYPGIGASIPPIVGIRRRELHRVLAGALGRHGVDVRLGVTVRSIEDGGRGPVIVTLSDGSAIECLAVAGADGIRSQIRQMTLGDLEPTYTGFGVWRSMHAKPASLDTKIMMMGVGLRLGIMPISRDQLYIFGTTREPDKPYYPPHSWAELMIDKFSAFKGPAAQFLDEVARGDAQVYYTAVEEVHLPLPWSKGRVVVIGDAAHSSSPFMGQGGAMALEDAVVLADILAEAHDVADTLSRFGRRRFERCKLVQDVSRAVGVAGAMEDAAAVRTRDERMRAGAQRDVDTFYARMLEPI